MSAKDTRDEAIRYMLALGFRKDVAEPPQQQALRIGIFADVMAESLVEQIQLFQAELTQKEEVGAVLASFGKTMTLRIEALDWQSPNLIILKGRSEPDGHACTLLIHQSQVNLLLLALPVEPGKEPRRIGFDHPPKAAER